MDTIDHFETNNPLGNDFEPLKKNLKNGPFYGSSEPSHVTPSRRGPLWNLIAEINRFDDICIPLAINVAFGENLFNSKDAFLDSLSTDQYKQGKKIVNKKPNTNSRVRNTSALSVKDGSGREWVKEEIVKSFNLNNSKALRGNKSDYIGKMIDIMKTFSEKRDSMFAKHPEKAYKKQDWLVF